MKAVTERGQWPPRRRRVHLPEPGDFVCSVSGVAGLPKRADDADLCRTGLRRPRGSEAYISAARRAVCLTFPVTQRDAVDRRTSRPVECERSAGGHSRSLAGRLPSGAAAARRLHRARPDAPYAATDIADMLARPSGTR